MKKLITKICSWWHRLTHSRAELVAEKYFGRVVVPPNPVNSMSPDDVDRLLAELLDKSAYVVHPNEPFVINSPHITASFNIKREDGKLYYWGTTFQMMLQSIDYRYDGSSLEAKNDGLSSLRLYIDLYVRMQGKVYLFRLAMGADIETANPEHHGVVAYFEKPRPVGDNVSITS